MGFRYKKKIKLTKNISLNISKSGISPSVKLGNITHNLKSKTTTVRLGNGWSYVFGGKKKKKQRVISWKIKTIIKRINYINNMYLFINRYKKFSSPQ